MGNDCPEPGSLETLEKEYREMVGSVTHMNKIMYRLVSGLDKKAADYFQRCMLLHNFGSQSVC